MSRESQVVLCLSKEAMEFLEANADYKEKYEKEDLFNLLNVATKHTNEEEDILFHWKCVKWYLGSPGIQMIHTFTCMLNEEWDRNYKTGRFYKFVQIHEGGEIEEYCNNDEWNPFDLYPISEIHFKLPGENTNG